MQGRGCPAPLWVPARLNLQTGSEGVQGLDGERDLWEMGSVGPMMGLGFPLP